MHASDSAPIRTVCCVCGALVRDGRILPGGLISHSFCGPCLDTWRAEAGLPWMAVTSTGGNAA
jgi:hypothetical protein